MRSLRKRSISSGVAFTSRQFFLCSFSPLSDSTAAFFFRFFLGFSSSITIKICRHEVTKRNKPMQVFAPRNSSAARNDRLWTFTPYSSNNSRTRTCNASAIRCSRRTVRSSRPFTIPLIVCLDTPNRRPSSASLTFFSSSLCADSAATHTFSVSFFVIKLLYKNLTARFQAVRLRFGLQLKGVTRRSAFLRPLRGTSATLRDVERPLC